MVDYEGLFFDKDEIKKIKALQLHPFNNIHECIHCTFIYQPDNDKLYDELTVGRYNRPFRSKQFDKLQFSVIIKT